jgi:hypothetical protein
VAHQDDTTRSDAAPDDWFDDHAAATTPSNVQAERRFTVLSDTSDHTTDDASGDRIEPDWFDSTAPSDHLGGDEAAWVTGADPGPLGTGAESFDERTALLREQRRTAGTPVTAQRSWWQRHRGAVAVTSAVAVLLGGGTAAVLWLTDTSAATDSSGTIALDEIVTTTAAPATSSAPAAAGTAAANVTWCAGQAAGEPVTSESTDPGMAAIWRFEKAFYYDRSGVDARAQATPDAVLASAQRLQQGIDALEADIEFCVLADPVEPGIYDVTVVERGPGIDGRTAAQRFTTAESGGKTLITAITQR